MKSITARVKSEAIPGGRVALYKRVPDGAEGATIGVCTECGEFFLYEGPEVGKSDRGETPEALACSHECAKLAGFFPKRVEYKPTPKVEPTPQEVEIPGDVEPTDSKPKPKPARDPNRKCSICGGKPKGSGFVHTADCKWTLWYAARTKVQAALKDKENNPNCPFCKGPRYRKGYKHDDDCPIYPPPSERGNDNG